MINTSKDPKAAEDFVFDWAAELGTDDSITASQWAVPAELQLITQSNTTKTTRLRLGGGQLGKSYTVSNTVTLQSGQTKVRSLHITIEQM